MASPRDLSEEGDAEDLLKKELGELRSAKKDLFEIGDQLLAQHLRSS